MALTLIPSVSVADEFDPDSVSTPYICLMDASSGTVLYQKSSNEHAYPASTTKIMTCILAIESTADLSETVSVGETVESRGSLVHLSRYEEMPLIDMLYGMMLESGNDAAEAIAKHVAGSESAFADLMNQKAAEIGMTGTHFVKPNGLHDENHYTTAYDMALLTRYAMQNETFREIVSTEAYNAAPTNKDSDGYQWENSNRLLHTKEGKDDLTYRYCTGVKTGDTANAGRCLVASAKKNGVELILVLFGDYENKVSSDYRFINAAKFFEWGFDSFTTVKADNIGLSDTMQLPVEGASLDDAEGGLLTLNIDLSGAVISGMNDSVDKILANVSSVTNTVALDKKLAAPIEEGEKIGIVSYQYDGATLFTAPMYASRSVEAAAVVVSNEPSSSPLIVNVEGSDGNAGGSSLVFWLLLAFLFLVLVVVAKLLSARRRRKHIAKRRKAYRS